MSGVGNNSNIQVLTIVVDDEILMDSIKRPNVHELHRGGFSHYLSTGSPGEAKV